MGDGPADPGQPACETIIRRFLLIAGLYTLSASLIWGVNTLFLLDAGLTLFETFLANAAFTAGMVAFEVPTGVVADTRGRRISFLASLIFLVLGTLAYVGLAWMGQGLWPFVAASIVLGLGFTFYSGAVDAWVVDALQATGYDGSVDQVFARSGQVTGAAMLVGTVSGGLLGQLDLAYPFLVRIALLVALFLLARQVMHDIGFQTRPLALARVGEEMRTILKASLQHGWGQGSVRLLMLLAFLQFGFLAWGWYAWQPYFLELLGRDLVWVAGIIAALISLATIAGNRISQWLAGRARKRTTVLA
ncbi:MAG: MFS transporter, partial [Candidatus Thermoplasmatota archaeon]|nr:MFS transporter [Candidatus Thermoplasmatota archaeon]